VYLGSDLRGQVKLTETRYTSGMNTKVGVQANKVALASYAHSLNTHMVDDGCTDPVCFFAGPKFDAESGCRIRTRQLRKHGDCGLRGSSDDYDWYNESSSSHDASYDGVSFHGCLRLGSRSRRSLVDRGDCRTAYAREPHYNAVASKIRTKGNQALRSRGMSLIWS
jgi:hypothetical protein